MASPTYPILFFKNLALTLIYQNMEEQPLFLSCANITLVAQANNITPTGNIYVSHVDQPGFPAAYQFNYNGTTRASTPEYYQFYLEDFDLSEIFFKTDLGLNNPRINIAGRLKE